MTTDDNPSESRKKLADTVVNLMEGLQEYWDKEVNSALERLSMRELHLVREAAVMGYVVGATRGPYREKIPKDPDILYEVIGSCLRNSDLYPAISTNTLNGVCLSCGSAVVDDEHVRTDLPPCHPSLTVRDLFVNYLMAADHYGTPEAGAEAYSEFVTELNRLGFKLTPAKSTPSRSDTELGYQQ